jgi:heme exporter protein B
MLQQVKELIIKDIRLNWRERYALYSMLLYVLSTSYVAYLSFEGVISENSWVALFWIIVLFAAMNASLQSFKRELNHQVLFFYTLTKPRAVILAKTLYNSGLLVFLTLISYCIYSLFLGNPITANLSFLLSIILGSSALASVLTLVAAIAAKTNNSTGLMAVLSMPLLFPLLLNLIKTSKICLWEESLFFASNQLIFLALLNIVSVLLSYLLFPYLWRD